MRYTCVTFNNSEFRTQIIFVTPIWLTEYTAIIFLTIINKMTLQRRLNFFFELGYENVNIT
jgi:hypothetical protein